jgi:hypothetical protein
VTIAAICSDLPAPSLADHPTYEPERTVALLTIPAYTLLFSFGAGQGLADAAHHVVYTHSNPRLLYYVSSHDATSNICPAPGCVELVFSNCRSCLKPIPGF